MFKKKKKSFYLCFLKFRTCFYFHVEFTHQGKFRVCGNLLGSKPSHDSNSFYFNSIAIYYN